MATELGTAYVQIVPSARGISGSIQSELSGEATSAGQAAGLNIAGAIKDALVGAGIGKVLKDIITTGSEFDSAVSQVSATMATAAQQTISYGGEQVKAIDAIRDASEELGRTTVFSASQAADGFNILAMAGYDAETAIATLPGVLDLAAAGGLDIAQAADYATGIIAGFSKETLGASRVGDVLATVASTAKGDVQSFGEGLSTVAGMATTTGQKMEDMTVALGILGNNNVAASEAGNALSRTLKNIYQPTDVAAKAMQKLGVSAYTSTGAARPLQDVLSDLNGKLDGMSDQAKNNVLSQIFDSATLKTVPALMNGLVASTESGTSAWQDLAGALATADGAAATMAATMTDNLQGKLSGLNSALEGFKISVANALMPALQQLTVFGTEAVQQLTNGIKEGGVVGFTTALFEVIGNAFTALIGALPGALQVGVGIINNIVQGVISAAPTLLTSIMTAVQSLWSGIGTAIDAAPAGIQTFMTYVNGILTSLPQLMTTAAAMISNLVQGILTALPQLITTAGSLITQFVGAFLTHMPTIMQTGWNILTNLLQGILTHIPDIVVAVAQVIASFIATVGEHFPEIIQTGFDILTNIITGLLEALPDLLFVTIPEMVKNMVDAFMEFDWAQIGRDIMDGIKNGILGMIDTVVSAAKGAGEAILHGLQGLFKTGSPSKLMRDEIGQWIPAGIAVGIEGNLGSLDEAMRKTALMTTTAYDAALNVAAPPLSANTNTSDVTLDYILQMMVEYFPDFVKNKGMSEADIYTVMNRQLGMAVAQ